VVSFLDWQAEQVISSLQLLRPENGLLATRLNTLTGTFMNRLVTFGGSADSYFEYLLKAWIQVCKGVCVSLGGDWVGYYDYMYTYRCEELNVCVDFI
jgi:hypothetical protein